MREWIMSPARFPGGSVALSVFNFFIARCHLMRVIGTATFLGAFLLFQIQPIIGKFVLPRFGGSPAVWTTCMLFFQVLLLAGYGYAHLSATRLKPRAQALLHFA